MNRKIFVVCIFVLLVISVFGSVDSKYNSVENQEDNNELIFCNCASSSEILIDPSNDVSFLADLDYTCMCEWVNGWDDHGPCKSSFNYGQLVYFYGEVSNVEIGDIFSCSWKKDGITYNEGEWNPMPWSGTGAIWWWWTPTLVGGNWQVSIYCNDAYIGSSRTFSVVEVNRPPNRPLTPIGPTNVWIGNTSIYSTKASDPEGHDVKYGWDWDNDSIVDEWTELYFHNKIVNVTHLWSSVGTYDIKVKAEDSKGAQSDFSNILEVIVTLPPNRPPGIPSISGKTSGKAGESYTYSASATDPEGDQVFYWFDWDDGTVSDWKGPYNSGEICQESHIWIAQGSYSLKVKAKDINDLESDWETLQISMPKNKLLYRFPLILQFLEEYPRLFPILRQILGL